MIRPEQVHAILDEKIGSLIHKRVCILLGY